MSGINQRVKILKSEEAIASQKRILVITLSNIGDVILTTPVIMALHAHFPEAKMTVVVGPRAKDVLAGSRFIDKLVIYDKHASLPEKWRFWRSLVGEKYEWVVDLRNTAIPYLVSARKKSSPFRYPKPVSFKERHLQVIQKMGLVTDNIQPFDFFSEADEASMNKKIANKGILPYQEYILVAPLAASQLKSWSLENYRRVIERLISTRSENILLVGSPKEKEVLEPLVSVAPGRVYNLAGDTTLRELAALVTKAVLVLANDSSVMQLSYEMNRPSVALFGPTNHMASGRTGPFFRLLREAYFCSPCDLAQCRFERRACLDDLKAERVFEACTELLAQKIEKL